MVDLGHIAEVVTVLNGGNMIQAIKKARDLFGLPLITAKCFVETLAIIDGALTCSHCNTRIDPNEAKVPKTIQVRR